MVTSERGVALMNANSKLCRKLKTTSGQQYWKYCYVNYLLLRHVLFRPEGRPFVFLAFFAVSMCVIFIIMNQTGTDMFLFHFRNASWRESIIEKGEYVVCTDTYDTWGCLINRFMILMRNAERTPSVI